MEKIMCTTSKRYTKEFKLQIVELINNGKPPSEVVKDYKIARSSIHKWVEDYNSSGSFKAKDNISSKDQEIKQLKKKLAYAEMENDILKQAALILGRK